MTDPEGRKAPLSETLRIKPTFKPNRAWVIIDCAYSSPLRPRTGHDLYKRSSPGACSRVGGLKVGGIHFELPKRSP